ncbi:MAG: hypothetical protein ABSE06_04215 [Anaerolineaceae bacterium]
MESPIGPKPVALVCPQCSTPINPAADSYTVCQYCGSNLVWNRQPTRPAEEKVVRGMRLKPFS